MPLRSLIRRDRRRWRRHWFKGSIRVSSGAQHIDGIGIKVSRGGMYLFAIADLPVGSEIKLAFKAPGTEDAVELAGTVRHRAIYLYGVEFAADQNDALSGAKLGAILKESAPPY